MHVIQFLIILILSLSVSAQDSLKVSASSSDNPLQDYLNDMDEMGRILSGWNGEELASKSWFFGSYAMLILSNNSQQEFQTFPSLETAIPALWKDFKYLTPRYLVELAGGTLSYGSMMAVSSDRPFESLRIEEQFIIQVAGFNYLRMLQYTEGDSVFNKIIAAVMTETEDPNALTDALTGQVGQFCGTAIGQQFSLALSSGAWVDAQITKVQRGDDSIRVFIEQKGIWTFPLDVLIVSEAGDSIMTSVGLDHRSVITLDRRPQRIILDPEHKLAEFYRYNNKWPRIRNNIFIQPFAALPDWENYRITVSPASWSDWNGNKRYGLRFTSGFGVDLWPAYPSDYRHRVTVELNTCHPFKAAYSWGGRLTYGHTLSRENRLFGSLQIHDYKDWTGASIGITKYIGKQRFLIQGPKLHYQRLQIALGQDQYNNALVWAHRQRVSILKTSFTGLSLTRYGDRLYLSLRSAAGEGSEGVFSVLKSQIDLSGVFWHWLVGGVQFVAGSESQNTPKPYQFTSDYAWQDNLAALPNFRGQTRIEIHPENYVGMSISGGYWLSWFQVKLFGSSMIFDNDNLVLGDAKPYYAAGFGLEHKSFFTAGLYFPIWQSHPLEGEQKWAWRYQWRLTWNL